MEKSIQQLFAKDDMFWWKRLFENDPMNGRLSEEQRLECIAFAVKAGETAAEEYVTRYGKGNLEELARKLGLCIRSDESCGFQNYIYFGVFSNSGEITLYEENFRKLDDYIIKKALHIPITGRIARDIVLAHEIYHYYEKTHPDSPVSRYRFISHTFGPIRLHSKLIAPEEIAAMAFARSLTGISFHPCILNILLLIPHDENKAWSLMLPPEEQYKLRVSDNRAKQLWNRLVKGGK